MHVHFVIHYLAQWVIELIAAYFIEIVLSYDVKWSAADSFLNEGIVKFEHMLMSISKMIAFMSKLV